MFMIITSYIYQRLIKSTTSCITRVLHLLQRQKRPTTEAKETYYITSCITRVLHLLHHVLDTQVIGQEEKRGLRWAHGRQEVLEHCILVLLSPNAHELMPVFFVKKRKEIQNSGKVSALSLLL
jgi:hypothetical protein